MITFYGLTTVLVDIFQRWCTHKTMIHNPYWESTAINIG